MKKTIDKEKVLNRIDQALKSIKVNTTNLLMALSVAMHVISTIYQKGFDLINRHPKFIRDCAGIIIDSINETIENIRFLIESDPKLKEDLAQFVKDVEGLSELYETVQEKITELVIDKKSTESDFESDSEIDSKKDEDDDVDPENSAFPEEAEYEKAKNIYWNAERLYKKLLRKYGPSNLKVFEAYKIYTQAKRNSDEAYKKYSKAQDAITDAFKEKMME